jgi:hypothetical protein
MKKILALLALALALGISSCTGLKRGQTAVSRAIVGEVSKTVDGHEIYCSQGPVCSEVDVLKISAEPRAGGKVRVTLKNRTGNTALLQIRLEIRSAAGELLTETRPENVAIPPTQEKTYEMPGVYQPNAVVRVILNTAY